MDPKVKGWIAERRVVKSSLTRFKTFVRESMRSTPVDNVQKRLAAHVPLFERFSKLQDQIDIAVMDTDMEPAQSDERDQFSDLYFSLITEVESYIKTVTLDNNKGSTANPPSGSAVNSIASHSQHHLIKLPTIQLPSFDGNYNDWVKFRDTFTYLIHQNDSLSDVQRFHYLSATLHGAAARVIQTLGVSEANYQIAWETLRARYDNSTALRRHHLNSLLDLPPIAKPSQTSIREFVDDANSHLAALKSLGESVEHWDSLIVALLSRKLDQITIREWEKRVLAPPHQTHLRAFIEFLEERSQYLENIAATTQVGGAAPFPTPRDNRRPERTTAHVANTLATCPVCSANHALYHCSRFKELDVEGRRETAKRARVCFNCLSGGHQIQACSRGRCKHCNSKHHTLLHIETVHTKLDTTASDKSLHEGAVSEFPNYIANTSADSATYTVLSTAIIFVRDCKGDTKDCRVLLDSGSQANFITDDFCKRLGLKVMPANSTIAGIGKATNTIRGTVQVQIASRCNSFRASIACLIMPSITTDMPNMPIRTQGLNIPPHVQLADPQFYQCRKVDMLIGAGLFWKLLCVGQHRLDAQLLLQKTQFGWVLGGKLPTNLPSMPTICHASIDDNLHTQLQRFWELEEPTGRDNNTTDDCEQHFRDTTQQDATGRYIVSVPFKENLKNLGNSREQAHSRLLALERKLDRNVTLKEQYISFLDEYERLGHMSKLIEPIDDTLPVYYLPHHAVSKDTSTTTKVRVVFDGSAKTNSGLSLNDVQRVGPTIQSDLFSILVRFRQHKYVLSADIEKMYRQILVRPDDRRFQRILWRSSPNTPIHTYQLNTVTYGTASAPFLATRVLQDIGVQCLDRFPLVSQVIIYDFYVDDLLTGADTLDQARAMKYQLTTTLAQHGLHLRKWAANHHTLLQHGTNTIDRIEIPADKDPKTLGLLWSPIADTFEFTFTPTISKRVTKRSILSDIAKIFDPLGLLGPIITTAKLILQQLWQLKSGWDESIPQELHTQWVDYRRTLHDMQTLTIPRRVLIDNSTLLAQVEIHGFSDASERAYGACIYLRSKNNAGRWTTRLLCAKSRVAPLKTVSLPRLELCAAVLLANLLSKVRSALRDLSAHEHLWSDSTITLAWLRSPPTRWKTFVANRVAEIQSLTNPDSWKHISSEDNPADLISRGVPPKGLINTSLWWSGPAWLNTSDNVWPTFLQLPVDPPEQRMNHFTTTLVTNEADIFSRFSKFTRLLRVVAYCFRFMNRARRKDKLEPPAVTTNDVLTPAELRHAELTLARLAQSGYFQAELKALRSNSAPPHSSHLQSLNVFLDTDGVIRVGGRLANAALEYDKKHQIILPSRHPFTKLLIEHEHARLLHAGPQQVAASIRERYWPLSCLNTVKGIIRTCVRCFKVRPRSIEPQMGQLPASRVTPARAFFSCGVDYAGPFFTKERTRSKITTKTYLCMFVCFVTKAVHLELATDLTTDAFLNCLRRFIARRGRCQKIISDNGRNFIGARNELRELGMLLDNKEHHAHITTFLTKEGIEWQLNPPHAPHFGGLWEGAIKSTKYHLKRVVGDQRLTFEELYTLLAQIESCLNSRPLTPLSSDPEDLNPLTPGHFLIGDALTALPEKNLMDINMNKLGRYQLLQQMLQHFWRRWHKEYLHHLQQRHKWRTSSPKGITKDTLVVIREDNLPPLQWQLGRIVETHPGADGIIRVVTVRTKDGIVKRPVTKLCMLPIEDNQPVTRAAEHPTTPNISRSKGKKQI